MSDINARNEFAQWVDEESEREKKHLDYLEEKEERERKEAIRNKIHNVVSYIEEILLNNPIFDGGSCIGDATAMPHYLKAYRLMRQTIEDLGEVVFEYSRFKWCFDSVEAMVDEHKKVEGFDIEIQLKNDLPKELDNPDIKDLFERAYKRGLMRKEGERYWWNKTDALLAYFVEKTSNAFELRKNIIKDSKEKQVFWKPFETYFEKGGLAKTRCNKKANGYNTVGSDIVDRLFLDK